MIKTLKYSGLAKKNSFIWLIGIIAILISSAVIIVYQNKASTSSMQHNQLFQLNYFYRSGGGGPQQILTRNSELHSGDHYSLWFSLMQEAEPQPYHVYILQTDSSERIYCLFPMKKYADTVIDNHNPVQVARVYHAPAENKAFELDHQTGQETIYFLAFDKSNEVLEQHCAIPLSIAQQTTAKPPQQVRTILKEAAAEEMDQHFILTFNHSE
jgi:hypothetical protein